MFIKNIKESFPNYLTDREIKDCILELANDQVWRETSSGLWRCDNPYGPTIEYLLMQMAFHLKDTGEHWVMCHKPGGGEVMMHAHNKWATALYYLNDHPSSLLTEAGEVKVKAGRMVCLEPGTLHGIQANQSNEARWSVVMLYNG